MKTIPWEDKKLADRQQEILVGSLLGDGRLECRSLQGTARFRVHHADSQHELLLWKYGEFNNLVYREPWCTDWYDQRYGRYYRSWFFHTETSAIFAPIYTRFYMQTRKQVPYDIVDDLTPLALGVWIADDGCRALDSLIINTQSFTYEEQEQLLNALKQRYEVCGTINSDRGNFRLRFNRDNVERLRVIIRSLKIFALEKKFLVPVTTDSKPVGSVVAAR